MTEITTMRKKKDFETSLERIAVALEKMLETPPDVIKVVKKKKREPTMTPEQRLKRCRDGWRHIMDADAIDVEEHKARAWIAANPRRAPRNFAAFFHNWMTKAHEKYRKTLPSNKPAGDYSYLESEDK